MIIKRQFPKYWIVAAHPRHGSGWIEVTKKDQEFIFEFRPEANPGFLAENNIFTIRDFLKNPQCPIRFIEMTHKKEKSFHFADSIRGNSIDCYMYFDNNFYDMLGCLDIIFRKYIVDALYNSAAYNMIVYGKDIEVGERMPSDKNPFSILLSSLNINFSVLRPFLHEVTGVRDSLAPDSDYERLFKFFKHELKLDESISRKANAYLKMYRNNITSDDLKSKYRTMRFRTNGLTSFIGESGKMVWCDIKIFDIEKAWNNIPFSFEYSTDSGNTWTTVQVKQVF